MVNGPLKNWVFPHNKYLYPRGVGVNWLKQKHAYCWHNLPIQAMTDSEELFWYIFTWLSDHAKIEKNEGGGGTALIGILGLDPRARPL